MAERGKLKRELLDSQKGKQFVSSKVALVRWVSNGKSQFLVIEISGWRDHHQETQR
jgi:hypothetical protein